MPSFNTSAYISSETRAIGQTFPIGHRQFFIPLNQRPFVWTQQQVTGLWTDLERLIGANYVRDLAAGDWTEKHVMDSMPHFLGNFIFVNRTTPNGQQVDEVEVFDGQQRLTAISMLASCLLDHAVELIQKRPSPEVSLTYAELMKWVYADPRNRTPRLVPDIAFQGLFDCLVINNRTLAEREAEVQKLAIDFSVKPDHRTLYERFKELHSLISARMTDLQEHERPRYLAAAVDVLSRFFLCIETTVPVEAFGLRVFSSLNTAATPLSAVDNLKNEFFVRLTKDSHPRVSATWRRSIDSLGSIPPKDFFRRRLLSLGKKCKNDDKDLFHQCVTNDLDGKSGDQLLAHLELLAGEAAVLNKIREASGFSNSTSRYLNDLYGVLGASIADITLLAAYRKFMPGSALEFNEATRLVRNFLLRELTIGQRDTAVIEQHLVSAAIELEQSGIEGLMRVLTNASKDESFFRNFSERTEDRPRIQFFLLFSIEEYLCRAQGIQPFPHGPRQHIEHIVPKKIDKCLPSGAPAWAYWKSRRRSLHERYLNRLGNLLLLEADINVSVKNRSFTEKVSGLHLLKRGAKRKLGYLDSRLRLPLKLAKSRSSTFGAEDIERRQRVLAKLALRVWPLV